MTGIRTPILIVAHLLLPLSESKNAQPRMRSGVLLGFYEAANVRKPVRPVFSTGMSEKKGQTCFLYWYI